MRRPPDPLPTALLPANPAATALVVATLAATALLLTSLAGPAPARGALVGVSTPAPARPGADDLTAPTTPRCDGTEVTPRDRPNASIRPGYFPEDRYRVTRNGSVAIGTELAGTQSVNVRIEHREGRYAARLRLTDWDGDGEVPLRVDTRYAGRPASSVGDFEAFGDDTVTVTSVRTAPTASLPPGTYDLTMSTGGSVTDTACLSVRPAPRVRAVAAWVVPNGSFDDLGTPGAVRSLRPRNVTASGPDRPTVAAGDVVVHRVRAASLLDRMAAANRSTPEDAFLAVTGSLETDGNRTFGLVQTNPSPELEPKVLDVRESVRADGFAVVPDRENHTLYLVTATGRARFRYGDDEGDPAGARVRSGERYRLVLERRPPGAERPVRSVGGVRVVERRVGFALDAGGVLRLDARPAQRLTGRATQAPGTRFRVRVRAENGSFARTTTAVVAANRTFETTVDLSTAPTDGTLWVSVPSAEVGATGEHESLLARTHQDDRVLALLGETETATIDWVGEEITAPHPELEVSVAMSDEGFIVLSNVTGDRETRIGHSDRLGRGLVRVPVDVDRVGARLHLVRVTVYHDVDDDGRLDAADEPFRRNGEPVTFEQVVAVDVPPPAGQTPTVVTLSPPADGRTTTVVPSPGTTRSTRTVPSPGTTVTSTGTTGPGFDTVAALLAVTLVVAAMAARHRD